VNECDDLDAVQANAIHQPVSIHKHFADGLVADFRNNAATFRHRRKLAGRIKCSLKNAYGACAGIRCNEGNDVV
jgi:hypothetical protein